MLTCEEKVRIGLRTMEECAHDEIILGVVVVVLFSLAIWFAFR